MLHCVEVRDAERREAIYRLRHAVYVDELGRRLRHADPVGGTISEPLDATAVHLAAYQGEGGALVGAIRMHFTTCDALGDHAGIYGRATRREPGRFAIVSRLVTRPEARGGAASAGLELARAACARGLALSVETAYIDCQAPLAPFFEWLGFDVVEAFVHPHAGPVRLMRLDLTDVARLERSGSPLLDLVVREPSMCAEGEHRLTG